MINWF